MIRHVLDNGLRVVMEKIPTSRSVSFGIWVKTGSRDEGAANNGVSHFIEHMLFKGTEKYDAKQIADIFDGIGGNVNAFTAKEYTCYYAKVLDQHLPIAIDVLAEMFFHSRLDEAELAKEKNVILEEIAMYEDTPDDMVHDLIAKAAYGDHPLAYSILGPEKNLKRMGPQDLRAYLHSHYTVENTVISLAGNIDDSILSLIERYFGGFGNHGDRVQGEEPQFQAQRIFHQKKTEQNHICLALPGLPLEDDRLYAMIVLNNLIGGGMSSLLFQEIREKRGLAYSVYSYHSAHLDSGLFTIYAGTAPKQTEEVLDVALDMLGKLTRDGISERELGKGKEQLKGNLILGLESTGSRMNRIGKNELMLGAHQTLDEMIAKIEAVSLDGVNQLIGQLFGNPFALALVGHSDKPLSTIRRDPIVVSRSN